MKEYRSEIFRICDEYVEEDLKSSLTFLISELDKWDGE